MFITNRFRMGTMLQAPPAIVAAACLVIGVFVGSAGVLVAQSRSRTQFFNSGLFTIGRGEGARLSLSLDDNKSGMPAHMELSFLDQNGTVLSYDEATVPPGGSASLRLEDPHIARAHARVTEADTISGNRRQVGATVEIYDVDTLVAKDRVCNITPNVAGPSRIPD